MKRYASNARLVLGSLALGAALAGLSASSSISTPARGEPAAAVDPHRDPSSHVRGERAREVRERFEQALVMLHAKQYEHAATALQRVATLAPNLPEAQVNLGFALLELAQLPAARRAFERAIELRAEQANAYYGLALVLDRTGDRAGARGAMKTFVHLVRDDHPFKARARAALWEWEQAGSRGTP